MRLRGFVIGLCVLLLAVAGVGWYVLTRLKRPALEPQVIVPVCTVHTEAGTVGLDPTQIANAATISAVGIVRKLPDQAIVIALAAAYQESRLENLTGGDRDSIGLFQQRPSQGWGTAGEIADPHYAADKFYTSLLKIKDWQTMRVTEAAQRVQRSAFPEAYDQWAEQSAILVEALTGRAPSALTCAGLSAPSDRGVSLVAALDAGVHADWGDVPAKPRADGPGLVIPAADTRSGWQYAHWLVAQSAQRGVAAVSYRDQQWTAQSGEWRKITTPVGDVVAEVYRA